MLESKAQSENWTDHSLSNPAVNLPCAEPLENFVKKLGWMLNPKNEEKCNREEIARLLCREFKLKPPITGDKIRTFLEVTGIYHEVAPCNKETTFISNRLMARWEIHTRPCATYEWSREVWHEVWEILFWRCFHLIPWWKGFAQKNGWHRPHDGADDFAYQVLLSSASVSAMARNRGYDLYDIANHYTVPTNFAFRALSSCTSSSRPLIYAVIRLNARPAQTQQSSLSGGLFGEEELLEDVVHAQVYHKSCRLNFTVDTDEPLSPDQQQEWNDQDRTFKSLSKHLRNGSVLQTEGNDPLYCYSRQPEPKQWIVSCLFGLNLPTEVAVITQQSPRCDDEIFLQIVPPRAAETFCPPPPALPTSEELLQHMIRSEWRQAAQTLTGSKTNARRGGSVGRVGR